jgi:predicted nucleic acid-binding protein
VALYLADSSIWSWADRTPGSEISAKLAERLEKAEIATCPVVILELLHRARTGEECRFLLDTFFAPLPSFPLTTDGGVRAIQVQLELARRGHGNHRRPAADFLIAAAAEEAGPDVVLWFLDKDLRVICEHTGQPYEAETRA